MEELVTDGAARLKGTIAPERSFEHIDEPVPVGARGFNVATFSAG